MVTENSWGQATHASDEFVYGVPDGPVHKLWWFFSVFSGEMTVLQGRKGGSLNSHSLLICGCISCIQYYTSIQCVHTVFLFFLCLPICLRVQWRVQNVWGTRTMKHLMRKAGGTQWSQPMEEDIHAVGKSAREAGLPKPFKWRWFYYKSTRAGEEMQDLEFALLGIDWSCLVQFF